MAKKSGVGMASPVVPPGESGGGRMGPPAPVGDGSCPGMIADTGLADSVVGGNGGAASLASRDLPALPPLAAAALAML